MFPRAGARCIIPFFFSFDFTRLLCSFDQNGSSNGELLIKNVQLKHAGQYTCTAQTPVDNVTASAHLVVRGEL